MTTADYDIDAHGEADEPQVVGPFPSEQEAIDYAYTVDRFLVQVLPLTSTAKEV